MLTQHDSVELHVYAVVHPHPGASWRVEINYTQLGKMRKQNTKRQSFGENVSELALGANVNNAKKTSLNLVTNRWQSISICFVHS